MLICDDYLTLRALGPGRPAQMPDDERLSVTVSTWWRILRPAQGVIRARATGQPVTEQGQLSRILAQLTDDDLAYIVRPSRDVIQLLDSRDFLPTAASLGLDYPGGLHQLETVAAAIWYNASLWYGSERNVSPNVAAMANDLGITVHIVS